MSLARAFESVSRRAAPAAMALLFPILLMAQNYVFGPNVRVNDDPAGHGINHMMVAPGQHSIAALAAIPSIWYGRIIAMACTSISPGLTTEG